MSDNLRESYKNISNDYLSKKYTPWNDFVKYYNIHPWNTADITLDIGAGNGRNTKILDASHPIAFDLSFNLLRGYIGPEHGSRVVGIMQNLPFRRKVSENIISIAVIHHLETKDLRIKTMNEFDRVLETGEIMISVWRKWRRGIREKIFDKIRKKESTDALFNVYRPWKDSQGKLIAKRFYHYFSFNELIFLAKKMNYSIIHYAFIGGRYNDANIFVTIKKKNLKS